MHIALNAAISPTGLEMSSFRSPQTIPQDLLLIRNFIDVPNDTLQLSPQMSTVVQTDDIDSSDSENVSEDEIEADLIPVNGEDELQGPKETHVLLSSALFRSYNSTVHCRQTRVRIQTRSLAWTTTI